jgi:hypothetical protein
MGRGRAVGQQSVIIVSRFDYKDGSINTGRDGGRVGSWRLVGGGRGVPEGGGGMGPEGCSKVSQ